MFANIENFDQVVINESPKTNRDVFIVSSALDKLEKGNMSPPQDCQRSSRCQDCLNALFCCTVCFSCINNILFCAQFCN